ncbi:DEAD-box ATP-dependent RNA helicase 36 [Pyrus ussuriensis x Pyrus communis]|uniref:DEAD-box ATP-dependent RNA helicase 36 n=1 Tax=Pyrus ussuriensis x Pyrus communis TaxID=2448454 RepID=A0A5N5FFJ4_9ROSA|nr:DEAD-box ATP-dependent RNA helicase 36 [Pyrus ussuriensis x Pyrus communis]
MAEEENTVSVGFPLFKPAAPKSPKPSKNPNPAETAAPSAPDFQIEKSTNPNPDSAATFADLGLADWVLRTCDELGMKKPTAVQSHCIPEILAGRDVLGIAQTGSGKTAAFALPILQRLSENPFGVFALVVTPTRELAYQLAEQFRALGASLHLRCSVVVGGMDSLTQTQSLTARPHVVIATPGRIKVMLSQKDIRPVFSNTKFLVLDEADRLLDVGFEEELRAVFECLPKSRQTLLFSATMTSELRALNRPSANKAYKYEAYEGFRTVDTLKQQYVYKPKSVKDVYLVHILSKLEDMGVRSAIIFVAKCRTCHLLSLLLEELDQRFSALYSFKSQSLRLAALHRFKSGQVPVLLATDVANRGLDIPTVDLVINYDIPRDPTDYVHRVGRTARAGRGGLAISFITQKEVNLVKKIEEVVGKQMEEFECKENDALADITKVFKARRVAKMKMLDDGFEEKEQERKKQKLKMLEEKGLLKKRSKKRKREKSDK